MLLPASSPVAAAAVLTIAVFLPACTPAASASRTALSPRASAGFAPTNLGFVTAQPDSVTEPARVRETDRLTPAENIAAARAPGLPLAEQGDGMHGSGWFWMPAMMLVGGLIWLILDK